MINTEAMRREQLQLAKKIVLKDSLDKVELIGGCDSAFYGNSVVSSVVLCDKDMKAAESQSAIAAAKIPYIPGYLFYREAPTIIAAYDKLEEKPDVLLVDGNGILHPRRIGIASQLGLVLDVPTIGVAKKLLLGERREGKIFVDNEAVAVELKSREHSKPLYVSPGHKISLATSVKIVQQCFRPPHKLPEPLHIAHRLADKAREEMEG